MATMEGTGQDIPIVCDLTAIPADQREAHIARSKRLLDVEFEERHELPDGYAWRFSADQYTELCAFIDNERRCCAFLAFTLEVAPQRGPLWLRITTSAAGRAALLEGVDQLPRIAVTR